MSASIDDVVTVTVSVTPGAAQARGFSNCLILGSSTVLPLYARIEEFESTTDMVTAGFATNSEEYKAATVWFSQKPKPTTVKVGRRFLAAQPGSLLGSSVSSTSLATFQAVTSGGFDIAIDGVNKQIFGLDFSGAADMPAVAALVQTALQVAVASTLCVWDAALGDFIITSPTTGTSSSIGYAVAPTHSGPPTDVSALLGLVAAGGAQAYTGVAIENLTASLTASAIFDPDFYGIVIAGASTQDLKDTMAFAEAGIYLHAFSDSNPTDKLASTTNDILSYNKTNGYRNSFGQWSATPYAAVSALARQLTVDLTQPNSAITLKFKQEPGIAADNLTETEIAALKGKNANYYTSFAAPGSTSSFAMFAEGVVGDGSFIDQVFNLAFEQAALQIAYFNALATQPTKIAQTDQGIQRIVQALDKVMSTARSAGVIAPGNWLGDDVGEVKNGDFLPLAFYTYASPVASQSQGDRDARKAPPITIISPGAGAVHSGSVQFNFQP